MSQEWCDEFFQFWFWMNGQLQKQLSFYDIAHFHICSICFLFEDSLCLYYQKLSICRLNQVEREHIPMKVWCLKCFVCTDSSDEQNTFDGHDYYGNDYLFVYKLFEFELDKFLQLEIKQKLSSIQKITCIIAIADKK